jgi:hypothetical protein
MQQERRARFARIDRALEPFQALFPFTERCVADGGVKSLGHLPAGCEPFEQLHRIDAPSALRVGGRKRQAAARRLPNGLEQRDGVVSLD